MGQRDIFSGTVVSGADPVHEEAIFKFASHLLGRSNIHVILQPGTEAVLALSGGIEDYYDASKLLGPREILETRLRRSWDFGSRHCVIVARVMYRPRDLEFEYCRGLVLKERRTVENWEIFHQVYTACITPDAEIVPVISLAKT